VEKMLPLYRTSHVVVVPLRAGGGTRLKILEAMAVGRPVVSTSIGCEGLLARSGEHLLIADSPREFAESVKRLLADRDLRAKLCHNARRLVEDHYDWALLGKRLMAVFHSATAVSESTDGLVPRGRL